MPARFVAAIRSSMRVKLILATAVIGLAFIGLAVGYLLTLQSQARYFEEALEETTTELYSIILLQAGVNHVSDKYNDYITNRTDANKERLKRALRATDERFNKTLIIDFGLDGERRTITKAHSHWHHSSTAIRSLLTQKNYNPEVYISNRAEFDHHFEETVGFLNDMNNEIGPELHNHIKSARSVTLSSLLTATAVLVLALSFMIVGIVIGTRSLINPLNRFKEGAARLGGNDFSYRFKLGRTDEFGAAADAFDSMADKLSKSHTLLEEMATHDELTNLYNRREFFHRLGEEFKRSKRYEHSFSLLMIDIDHFKTINDRYGHQAGDNLLRAVAMLIVKELRPADLLARYGGDEIAALLPETPGGEALRTAERICQSICAQKIKLTEETSENITVSIGVAGFPDDSQFADQLLKAADKALYKAKNSGRGRACGYGGG